MNWTATASTRDPLSLFDEWYRAAESTELNDANAVALATTDRDGLPNVRMVLLKGADGNGFVFYTNLDSVKGREIAFSQKAAMCFHWKSVRRQVRLRGVTEAVSDEDADRYFASRARRSRLGAWASLQSEPMAHKRDLIARATKFAAKFGGSSIPRPDHWSGIRVKPLEIEFWQDSPFRMHDRLKFERLDIQSKWQAKMLFP